MLSLLNRLEYTEIWYYMSSKRKSIVTRMYPVLPAVY